VGGFRVVRESSAREIGLSAIGKPLIGLIILRIVQHEFAEIITFFESAPAFVRSLFSSLLALSLGLDGFLRESRWLAYRLLELVTDFN
jgi:hypothetical protein